MSDIKKRAQLSLETVNEKVDLVTEIDMLKNENARLKKALEIALMQIESDKWYKPEALRAQHGIDKLIAKCRKLL